jgi:hypothetical protein
MVAFDHYWERLPHSTNPVRRDVANYPVNDYGVVNSADYGFAVNNGTDAWAVHWREEQARKASEVKIEAAESMLGILRPWMDDLLPVIGYFEKEFTGVDEKYSYGMLFHPTLDRWFLTGPRSPQSGMKTEDLVVFLVSGIPAKRLMLASAEDLVDAVDYTG